MPISRRLLVVVVVLLAVIGARGRLEAAKLSATSTELPSKYKTHTHTHTHTQKPLEESSYPLTIQMEDVLFLEQFKSCLVNVN